MFLPNSQEVNNMKVLLRKMLKEIGLNLKWSGTSLKVPFQILNLLLTFDFGIFLFNQLWIKVEEIIENLYNYYLKNKKWWTLLIAFTRYTGYVSLTPVLLKLVLFFAFFLFVCFLFCFFLLVCLFFVFVLVFWSSSTVYYDFSQNLSGGLKIKATYSHWFCWQAFLFQMSLLDIKMV